MNSIVSLMDSASDGAASEGSDAAAMTQASIAYATEQIIDLYANGVKAVHVYSMNKPEVARAIKDNLSQII